MILALRVFAPFAFGYFLSYTYRVVNATIAGDLANEMALTAGDLGLLTSTYFLTFAAFQIPLGMLLDRFGARRTESILLLFAAAGAFVFAFAPNVPMLILGRALIGLGVSACLMGAFKAFVQWFPGERLPLINGFQMAVGALGAMTATTPVEIALGFMDWRGVFLVLGALTLLCAAVLFAVVPDPDGQAPKTTLSAQFGGVRAVHDQRAVLARRAADLHGTSLVPGGAKPVGRTMAARRRRARRGRRRPRAADRGSHHGDRIHPGRADRRTWWQESDSGPSASRCSSSAVR